MHWFIFVLLMRALAGAQDGDLCPENEYYDPCYMSPCPRGQGCTQVCSEGCRCKNGFVRDGSGKCGKLNTKSTVLQPPRPVCPKNEHFEINSNRCQITCDNMQFEDVMGACAPNTACYCNNGYVKDKNGNCIKREN